LGLGKFFSAALFFWLCQSKRKKRKGTLFSSTRCIEYDMRISFFFFRTYLPHFSQIRKFFPINVVCFLREEERGILQTFIIRKFLFSLDTEKRKIIFFDPKNEKLHSSIRKTKKITSFDPKKKKEKMKKEKITLFDSKKKNEKEKITSFDSKKRKIAFFGSRKFFFPAALFFLAMPIKKKGEKNRTRKKEYIPDALCQKNIFLLAIFVRPFFSKCVRSRRKKIFFWRSAVGEKNTV
jgi:hypothetical protein